MPIKSYITDFCKKITELIRRKKGVLYGKDESIYPVLREV